MRISFVIPYFYPAMGYGGTPRFAYELARVLARRGHRVKVLTTDSAGRSRIPSDVIRSIQKNGVGGIQVRYYRNVSSQLAYRQRFFFPPRMFFDMRREVMQSDVLHIHDLRSFLAVAAHSALRSLHKPYVLSPHGGLQHLGKRTAKTMFDLLWGSAILKEAAALCAVSPSEARDAILLGVEKQKIHNFPSAVDAGQYRSLPERGRFASKWNVNGRRIILYLGRLHWIKGVDILIESFRLLSDLPDVQLVIAGPDDGAEPSLRSLVHEIGFGDRVTLTGFLNDGEKTEAIVDSQIVVVPSRSEGFPLALLESLACGRPVIMSSACDLGDWMPKQPAWSTFLSEDAVDLARSLRAMLQQGVDEQSLMNARNLVLTAFSSDTLAARAEGLYESVVASYAST